MPNGLLQALNLKPLRQRVATPTAVGGDEGDTAAPPGAVATPQAPGAAPPAGAPQAAPQASGDKPADDKREQEKAKRLIEAYAKTFAKSIAEAEPPVKAIPIPGLKAKLTAELDAMRAGRAEVDKLDPIEGAKRMRALDSQASRFALNAESVRREAADAVEYMRERGDKPFDALKKQLEAQPADVQAVYKPRFDKIKGWLEATRPILETGDAAKLIDAVGRVYIQGQDLSRAIANHEKFKPEYDALRANVVEMIQRMKDSGMLDADGLRGIDELNAAVGAADTLGPIRGYHAAKNSLNAVVAKGLLLRDNNEAYRNYVTERDKVDKALQPLRNHAQADKLKSELKALDRHLSEADKLAKRSDGGALKALTALKAVAADGANLKVLAGKLAAAEKKLPSLTKKLEAGGMKRGKLEETARMALKVMVEEECTEEAAVKMAKDAAGYRDEGLEEQDAMMSSRVKKSLEDQGLAPDHAKSIGRNVRAGGSATADDAKATATAMKGVSKKAIDTLNKSNIHTQCCRGPITDAIPDLAGVKPMGWPETASWDEVVGVYSPSRSTLVVGTIEKDGKRKVPEAGEGPNPHGATDLFGHEAGHAFDAADGGGKRNHADFIKARDADKASGKLIGKRDHGNDNYFLTEAEGGTNTKGAIGETFAESFAMHFTGKARWPSLEAFWVANPWGI